MDALALARLLAEEDRRRVVAALILGADSLASVVAASDLDVRRVAVALARLVDGGLVITGDDGLVHLIDAAFGAAARSSASAAPSSSDELAGTDPEAAKVLRAFVREGRLLQIPVQRSKRLVVLDVLAQEFEPGRRYDERMVNLVLGRWHADTAALRRYLVDEGFLDRAAGEYWRTGGSVDAVDSVAPEPGS